MPFPAPEYFLIDFTKIHKLAVHWAAYLAIFSILIKRWPVRLHNYFTTYILIFISSKGNNCKVCLNVVIENITIFLFILEYAECILSITMWWIMKTILWCNIQILKATMKTPCQWIVPFIALWALPLQVDQCMALVLDTGGDVTLVEEASGVHVVHDVIHKLCAAYANYLFPLNVNSLNHESNVLIIYFILFFLTWMHFI